MRILSAIWILSVALAARSQSQAPLRATGSSARLQGQNEATREWSSPPPSYETGQWVFHSVSGHLRHWPNILYRNGHSIVPGTIAPGILLYHGRPESSSPPLRPEWVSFDPEHSYLFGRSLYTYVVGDEPLKVLYFDGSSASNMKTGTIDTQEILLHGEIRKGGWIDEYNRLKELCEWGKEFGIQGFVRMEFDFEVMICDFQHGIHLVSSLDLLPVSRENWDPPKKPTAESETSRGFGPPSSDGPQSNNVLPRGSRSGGNCSRSKCDEEPGGHWQEPPTPHGWKGMLRPMVSVGFEAIQAGNWHNRAPGVNGVTLDYAGMVSFFDPKYTSLVHAREGVDRKRWRVGNITKEDMGLFKSELRDVLTRKEKGSGVRWEAIVRGVVERHAGRLEFLSDWLGDDTKNGTYIIEHARRAVLAILSPYLTVTSIPSDHKTNTTWLNPTIHHCSTAFTAHLPVNQFTSQEHRLKDAVEVVTREICRTIGLVWIDAFDSEELRDEREQRRLLTKWKGQVDGLMDWLGWTEWVKCKPACNQYEMCSLPQWPFDMGWMDPEPDIRYTPKCMSRIEQDLGRPKSQVDVGEGQSFGVINGIR